MTELLMPNPFDLLGVAWLLRRRKKARATEIGRPPAPAPESTR